MAKTKKPTGLVIKRNGYVFTLTWKIGDSNYGDGQTVQYRTSASTTWKPLAVSAKATSRSVTIDKANYYPNKSGTKTLPLLSWVEMRVRGNRESYKSNKKTINPSMSDWSVKRYTIGHPKLPSLTVSHSSDYSNVCTFTWATDTSTTNAYWFTDVEWQSVLVKESNVTDGSKLKWNSSQLGWQTGTGTEDSSRTITENSALLVNGSYTRWFRVRSRGVAGVSINSKRQGVWKYSKHVYGLSYQALITSATATVQQAGGYQCKVVWEAPSSASHPIDKTTVEYAIAVPDSGMACPDEANFTSANTSKDTGWSDAAVFPIDRLLGENECLFIRVNTEHDGVVTYGIPVLADVGRLSVPTLTSVTEGDNYMVTINATNNSTAVDSFIVVLYRPASDPVSEIVIGTIPHGQTSGSFQAPDWSEETAHAFGVYAAIGDEDTITHDSAIMKSEIEWGTGNVPKAPENVRVSATSISGTIRVEWDWTWTEADGAELSWADHEDAWESTDEPDTYEIPNIKNSRWNISGLETGQKWYVKVRLFKGSGDDATYGAYSELKEIDLTSAPSIPTLVLSESVITEDGSVTASWVYTTTDGTEQSYADICEATVTPNGLQYGTYFLSEDTTVMVEDSEGNEKINSKDYYEKTGEYEYTLVDDVDEDDNPVENEWYEYRATIAHTETAQHVTINAQDAGWEAGNIYNLCVRVVSASGRVSDEWSAPVSVTIAEPLEIEITQTSLEQDSETQTVDGQTVVRNFLSLTEMPLTVTVEGAGDGGTTTVAIERSESYYIDRPDETNFTGYEGETVALYSQTGEDEITISDLIGTLDDGASYRIVATVQDGLGQSAEAMLDFEVHWEHQAIIPEGSVVLDEDNLIAKITPTAPTGALQTDVCDIYRLSVDRPQLVVKDGEFGETYVDPYATLGEFGGYRLVFRTANGDYITEDNEIAWLDLTEESLDADYTIIDFDGGRIMLYYNVDESSAWSKDFQETKYLGGSVQGDWNPAVSRTSNVSAVAITITDEDQIEMIHRLAVNPSICHVRTKNGSSYAADVQVSEDHSHDKRGKIATYTFNITRVDSEGLDGMTLAQWEELNEEEE